MFVRNRMDSNVNIFGIKCNFFCDFFSSNNSPNLTACILFANQFCLLLFDGCCFYLVPILELNWKCSVFVLDIRSNYELKYCIFSSISIDWLRANAIVGCIFFQTKTTNTCTYIHKWSFAQCSIYFNSIVRLSEISFTCSFTIHFRLQKFCLFFSFSYVPYHFIAFAPLLHHNSFFHYQQSLFFCSFGESFCLFLFIYEKKNHCKQTYKKLHIKMVALLQWIIFDFIFFILCSFAKWNRNERRRI